MKHSWILCVVLLMSAIGALTVQAQPMQSQPSQAPAAADTVHALRMELDQLKTEVATQAQQIDFQRGALEAYAQKKDSSNTPLFAALGVALAAVLAAVIGGVFALKNQNQQAAQGRLLKAVELIMESRSGYQAEMRRKNLAGFLDEPTNRHLERIQEEFSGPEFTDLHLALAQQCQRRPRRQPKFLRSGRSP